MSVLLCLVFLAVLLLVASYLQWRWRYRYVISAASKLPGPPTWPLIGNLLFLGSDFTSLTDNIFKLSRQFKGVFCIWEGLTPMFIVADPSDVQIVLNSSSALEKDCTYKLLKPIGVDGLISSPVSTWKKYRRLINPVLHPSNIKLFLPVLNNVSRDLVDRWALREEAVEPKEDIFNALVRSVFGTIMPLNNMEPMELEILKNFQNMFNIGGLLHINRVFKIWLRFDWLFSFYHHREIQKFREARSRSMEFLDKILKNWKSCQYKILDLLQNKNDCAKNLLDVIFENPDCSDDHDWRDEMKTMVGAASNTSTETLQLLLVTLANHPDIQAKVLAEVREVLGDSERDITMEDLNSLTYLGQTVLESLRLHGVIAVILRQATKDISLTSCMLPTGSRIMIPIHAMGWNSDLFPNPSKFLPERFSPDNIKNRHSSAFLPFSGGPRNCIGKTYALTFLKIALAHILKRYKVRSEVRLEDIKYEVTVVRHSKTPLLFTFEPH